MPKSKSPSSFAERIQMLQALVSHLEEADLPLDQSLKEFEEGIQLVRDAQEELATAEQKVNELLQPPIGQPAEQD
ncbi:exodeoxyribonuclease VII small subunit [Seongchinamella unica]|uniref:Exodeoxyribonuclease 7 small subunit n=1 Tax=Seongchinamella unica TaxID=2547392 RepID=A0A4R5LQC3_9GAMM|nr:exodeoxyribonuclease VII small subunit [Seongchinamella unica]TDG12762.1 exodeoxyribonuclease VII small subunit [Seongchinamella unica]